MNSESKCLSYLKKYFKFDSFKSDLQRRAVLEVAKREHDVLVLMPTGSGKSLCYQLPGLLFEGQVVLVFSPLLSLIKDQIDHLLALNIRAASINSHTTSEDKASILNDLLGPVKTRFLFITPELAATNLFRDILFNLFKSKRVAFIVIDEVHCVSEWGHDFRPDYLRLSKIRFDSSVPVVALTATANNKIIEDVERNLSFRSGYKVFKTTCFRSNLFYDIVFQDLLENPYEDLANFITKCFKNQTDKPSGIIYCRTRDQTELIPSKLEPFNINCGTYHGGLSNKQRLNIQEQWFQGIVPVICATISFGMGVDKSNVRFVVHWGVPKEPASYYQETGRAGRDGKMAYCRVYYSRGERSIMNFLFNKELSESYMNTKRHKIAEATVENFHKIVDFIENPQFCRHKLFTNHFGDEFISCNDLCDYCLNPQMVKKTATQMKSGGGSNKRKKMNTKTKPSPNTSISSDSYNRQDESYNDYENESSEHVNRRDNDLEAGKQMATFIKAKLAARRRPDTTDTSDYQSSNVLKANLTEDKISGLNNKIREQYVRKIWAELLSNHKAVSNSNEDMTAVLMKEASQLECNAFSSKKTIATYRNAATKIVREIRVATSSRKIFLEIANEITHKSAPQSKTRRTRKRTKQSKKTTISKTKKDWLNISNNLGVRKRKRSTLLDQQEDEVIVLDDDDDFKSSSQETNNEEFTFKRINTSVSTITDDSESSTSSFKQKSKSRNCLIESDDEDLLLNDITTPPKFKSIKPTSTITSTSTPKPATSSTYDRPVHSFTKSALVPTETNTQPQFSKQNLGAMIIKILTPAYCQKKIQSRDQFKQIARDIGNKLLQKNISGESDVRSFTEKYLEIHLL